MKALREVISFCKGRGPSANTGVTEELLQQTALHLKNVMFNVSQILALNSQ